MRVKYNNANIIQKHVNTEFYNITINNILGEFIENYDIFPGRRWSMFFIIIIVAVGCDKVHLF